MPSLGASHSCGPHAKRICINVKKIKKINFKLFRYNICIYIKIMDLAYWGGG